MQNIGIIEKSKETANKHNQELKKEQEEILKSEYEIAKYEEKFSGTYEDYLLEKQYGLKIGDYVDYTYDTVNEGYLLEKTYSGYSEDQMMKQTTGLKWRVLGLNEEGNVELISEKIAGTIIHLRGATGYNNGVYLLNNMCKELYGNSKLGITARSMNIEDIEKQFSDEGINERDNYVASYTKKKYGQTKFYDANNKYPIIYEEEVGSGTNGTIRKGGIGQSEIFYKKKENLTVAYDENENEVDTAYKIAKDVEGNNTLLNVTQTYYYFSNMSSEYFKNKIFYNMIFGTGTYYYLSSRCVNIASSYAEFGLFRIGRKELGGATIFRSSTLVSSTGNYALRPVVTLPSNIYIDTSTGNGTVDSMYNLRGIK